jgi:hypothetical protein
MAGELIIKNGINVSGSIIAQSITGSFTGSFNGTSTSSSFATTSSIATFASTASFVNPLTQSVSIKGRGTTSATTTLRVENANVSASLVVLDNTNVGIGTSNPSARLEVAGVTTGTAFKVSGGFTGFTGQYFYINEYGSAAMVGTTTDPNNLLFGALGTSDTFARLAFGFLYDKPYLGFGPGNATRDIYLYRDNADLILGTTTSNTEKLRVKASGNLLIGTTTDPGYKLNVSGSGNFTNNLTVTGSLQVTGGITGSLLGTGSYATQALSSSFAVSASRAVSASYAPSTPAFPYTGSAEVTGSLSVVGTTTVSGSIIVQGGSVGIVSTGTTNATEAFKVQNATPEVLFNVKDDGGLEVNTVKYPGSGVLESNNGIIQQIIGWNGTININQPAPNPPISIFVQNGVITNVI